MTIQENIKLHNLDDLSTHQSQNANEVCFIIEAQEILSKIDKAYQTLESNKKNLQENGYYDLFAHVVYYGTGKYQKNYLVNALRNNDSYKKDSGIYGLYNFNIGFYFLREQSYQVAKEYLKESIVSFDKANLPTWSWRSKFNIFLVDNFIDNFEKFDQRYDNLFNDYSTLSNSAHFYFSSFLIWLCLFRGDLRSAFTLCASQLAKRKERGRDYSTLENYSFYINYIYKNVRLKCDSTSDFSLKMSLILDDQISSDQLEENLRSFTVSQRFMLIHIYYHKLYLKKQFAETITTFEHIYALLGSNDFFIIPPCNLFEYPLLASLHLKDTEAQEEYLFRIKKHSPHWVYQKCLKRIQKEKTDQIIIYYIKDLSVIDINGRQLNIQNKKLLKKLLTILCEGRQNYCLNTLARKIYGERKNINDIDNIKSICFRSAKLLDEQYYHITNGTLIIKDNITFMTKSPNKGRVKKVHPETILSLLKSNPTKSMTAKKIGQVLKISHRSVTSNLKILINDQRIKRLGKGPSTRYHII